jgi:hypothetical protein
MNTEPLFFQPRTWTKVAGHRMPSNVQMWQTEVTKYLASQHPYLDLSQISISFKNLDPVKGAAVGSVSIPEKEIVVPIIIGRPGPGADPELKPMDVFLHKGKAHHLSPRSIQQLAHDPQIGDPAGSDTAQGGPRSMGSNPYVGDLTGDASPMEYSGQASPFAGPFDAFSVKAAGLSHRAAKAIMSSPTAMAGVGGAVTGGLMGGARGATGLKIDKDGKVKRGGVKGAIKGALGGGAVGGAMSAGMYKAQSGAMGAIGRHAEKAASLIEEMSKLGYLEPNDLTRFRRMLASNPQTLQGLSGNLRMIETLMRYRKPATIPSAPEVVRPNIIQVYKDPVSASLYYKFSGGQETRTGPGELRKILGDKFNEAMAQVNSKGSYVLAEEVNEASWEPSSSLSSDAKAIMGDGLYMVRGKGNDTYHGFVAQRVMRVNGENLPVKLFVAQDGRYALAGELFGVKLTRKNRFPAVTPVGGQTGCFISYVHGTPIATTPMRINSIVRVPTDNEDRLMTIYNMADPVTGENMSVIPQEGVLGFQRVLEIEPTAMTQTRGDIYYIPKDADWVRVSQPIDVAKSSDQLSKIASIKEKRSLTHVAFNGSGFYVKADFGLEKSAGFEVTDITRPEARELLTSMGMDHDGCEETLDFAHRQSGLEAGAKIAGLHGPQARTYSIKEKVVEAVDQALIDMADELRPDAELTKAAAEVGGQTLDAVLSLNFVNPKNIRYFTDNLEKLEDIVGHLAGLLIAVRLGMKHVTEEPVQEAMEGLSKVVGHLRLLKSAMDHKKESA